MPVKSGYLVASFHFAFASFARPFLCSLLLRFPSTSTCRKAKPPYSMQPAPLPFRKPTRCVRLPASGNGDVQRRPTTPRVRDFALRHELPSPLRPAWEAMGCVR